MIANRLPAVFVPLLCAAVAGCSINLSAERHVSTEKKSFPVTGRAEVSLKTFDGPIEVTTWDRPEVAVTIERYAGSEAQAEALQVEVEQAGNSIRVEAIKPEKTIEVGFNGGRGVKLIVSLPAESDLQAGTGDGSISAEGVRGTVALRTGDGAVRAKGLSGNLTINTGDGSVTLEGVSGRLDVSTGDGSVRVEGAPTALRAHTGDGSVALNLRSGASFDDDWEITTGDGSIQVSLPDGLNAEVDARTGDGRVSGEGLGLEVSESRRALTGRLGTGGRQLKIRTGDGSISLSRE